ncbi:MAG: site-specific DNA-methyltransferase [Anaerolineales bacterium]|nr:site-specific DNA-methyltransferase [Anaerolineales bacterium]
MPTLTWPSKSLPDPQTADLSRTAIIYPSGQGYPDANPENHLIRGDNLSVMAALLPDHEGRLDLIYADPPFFTNKRYRARIGRGEDSRRPHEWQLAEGYADHWKDIDAYLDFLYPRLALMARLLAPHGTLYLHLDWHVDAYARLLLDELFGRERLLNEIIWAYHGPSPIRRAFNRKHDTLLVYTKGDAYTFNADAVREPYNPNTVKTFATSLKAGFGKIPDLERGKVPEDWWYFPVIARLHHERTGYPTQKPEALLTRIVLASSNPGDLVADFFCGSGTLPLVAARYGRRFLACDVVPRAIQTTCGRLVKAVRGPFAILDEARPAGPQQASSLEFERKGRIIRLKDPPSLEYWEVDPAWDGETFRSAAQAQRPTRSGDIPLWLSLPVEPRRICIRAVTVDGELLQTS